MKRKVLVFLIGILTFSGVSACLPEQTKEKEQPVVKIEKDQQVRKATIEATFQEVLKLTRNSDLGLDYFTESELSEEAEEWHNDDVPQVVGEKDMVVGYYFRYPAEAWKTRLTQLKLKSSGYNVYGIEVGDEITTVAEVMKKEGYSLVDSLPGYTGTNSKRFQKEDVHLTFETAKDETQIIAILLSTFEPKTVGNNS